MSTGSGTVEVHGYALRVIREARGRKTADLAQSIGVDRSYITRIELGYARRVSAVVYSRLLRELQVDDHRALLANPPTREAAA
ncbi:helix-turn-helix domain-containing protein [Isoptericola sp. NPDC056605]|uniref:helix-turn-helix domain-containing protein n=1 Tax=Isoptericola sp. NPDC056605 TaxID=3345876 RepID=UPI00369B3B2C